MQTEENHENNSELAKMKLPLVLRDYQSYFEGASRLHEIITQLRSWEAALVSGLCVVILTGQKPIEIIFASPLLFIIFVFAFLEGSYRAEMVVVYKNVLEVEKWLQTGNIKKFEDRIINWTFSNTLIEKQRPSKVVRYKNIIREILRPTIMLWHGGLILAIITLAMLSR